MHVRRKLRNQKVNFQIQSVLVMFLVGHVNKDPKVANPNMISKLQMLRGENDYGEAIIPKKSGQTLVKAET